MNTLNITNYKPKDFAELLGVSVKTLQRWDREGILKANRTPTDRRYYTYDQYLQFKGMNTRTDNRQIVIYARVSTRNQKDDLNNQVDFLRQFCNAKGFIVGQCIEDFGSGLNYNRKKWNKYQKDIAKWFHLRGYTTKSLGKSNHDVFQKEPVLNFEMHTSLYDEVNYLTWKKYYDEKVNHLLKVDGYEYRRKFSDEDLYIYIICHAYKHHQGGGTGLRTLVDFYVLNNHFRNMDRNYIATEMKKLGIYEFEQQAVSLSSKLFGNSEPLNSEEQEMLKYILLSGTYGTIDNYVNNKLTDNGKKKITLKIKIRYAVSRIFPTYQFMKRRYGVKSVWLLPFYYIYRIVLRLFTSTKKISKEIKILFTAK